jgi:hypothetical protein
MLLWLFVLFVLLVVVWAITWFQVRPAVNDWLDRVELIVSKAETLLGTASQLTTRTEAWVVRLEQTLPAL